MAMVLIGATFTACSEDDAESANVGLGIKTFFPTKVVTNQPITINGSGFDAITEIEFPGGAKVTNFELPLMVERLLFAQPMVKLSLVSL